MFFFPYSSDAPIYYWPYATVGLIVANIVVFFAVFMNDPGVLMGTGVSSPWLLVYGEGLHPDQWLASGFMHVDIFHLLGNMLFLWVFGLVVEGKLGAIKFLICYLAIMISESAIEQTIMLMSTSGGGSLGASAAIFGIMAIASLWAPANNVNCKWGIGLFYMDTVEIPVAGVAAFYIGLEVLFAFILNYSSLLHLGGVAIGISFGLVMLKTKVVDCEGWDIFSVLQKNAPGADKQAKEDRKQYAEKIDQRKQDRESKRLIEAADQICLFLQEGNLNAAYQLHKAMKSYGEGPQLTNDDLVAMVRQLHKVKRFADSVPFMQQLIQREPDATHPIRLKLAHICVVEIERPGYALELLTGIDSNRIKEEQRSLAKKLVTKARRMQEEGVVELDEPIT